MYCNLANIEVAGKKYSFIAKRGEEEVLVYEVEEFPPNEFVKVGGKCLALEIDKKGRDIKSARFK